MNHDLQEVSLRQLKRSIRLAVEIADRAPGPAVGELRKVLDVMIRSIYRRTIRDPRTEPMQNLIGTLSKAGYLPAPITDCANLVKNIGNVGVHSAQKTISEAEFVSALQNLLHVLRWYERDRQTILSQSASHSVETELSGDKEAPYTDKTVILAWREPESDVEEEWHAVRKFLINYGVTVLSDEVAQGDRLKIQNAVFVQLFSMMDRLDRAKLQFQKFSLEYGPNHILQWRKTLPKSKANSSLDVDLAILNSLDEEDRRFCEGAQTGSFEEFKLQVRSQLERGNTTGERPYLYLTFDRSNERDDRYATKLVKVAAELADVKVMPAKNQRRDFFGALRKASGFVFLFGDTEPSFIEDWIGYYIDGKRAIKANVRLAALYQAPPLNGEKKAAELKIGLRREEWRTYGSRDEFIPEDIEQYLAELRRDRD